MSWCEAKHSAQFKVNSILARTLSPYVCLRVQWGAHFIVHMHTNTHDKVDVIGQSDANQAKPSRRCHSHKCPKSVRATVIADFSSVFMCVWVCVRRRSHVYSHLCTICLAIEKNVRWDARVTRGRGGTQPKRPRAWSREIAAKNRRFLVVVSLLCSFWQCL